MTRARRIVARDLVRAILVRLDDRAIQVLADLLSPVSGSQSNLRVIDGGR